MAPIELQARREALGMSQATLADHLGVSRSAVHQWETGKRPVPEGIAGEVAEWEEWVTQEVARLTTLVGARAAEGLATEVSVWSDAASEYATHLDSPSALLHRVAAARARAEAAHPDQMSLTETHLIAHYSDGEVLVAEHSSDPDEYGYQLADVIRFDAATRADAEQALADHRYRVVGEWGSPIPGVSAATVEEA